MKKQWAAALLAGMLTLSLCACGKREAKHMVTAEETATPTATPTVTPTRTPRKPKNALEAYQRELEKMLEEYIEQAEAYHYDLNMVGQPEFAVCDVNMDGEPELIIHDEKIFVAGQRTEVFGYDPETGEVTERGRGHVSCRFYSNGTMQNDESHNQGWAGRFWPFTAYRYDETARAYQEIAFVDAWDQELMEEAWKDIEEKAKPRYPQEVDKEGAGFVYYIREAGEDGTIQWERQEIEPISQSDYDAWYDSIFGGAREIELNYRPLTAANVENLYYEGDVMPKVDIDMLMWRADEGTWDGLSERQWKLIEDLPADKLPREAAGGEMTRWTRGDIWEDLLLPICYDEKNDFTLYAVVNEDSIPYFEDGGYLDGKGVVVRLGDETERFSIGHEQFWTGNDPRMVVKDLNGDGGDEAAVALLSGHGTGVSVEALYIFDLGHEWIPAYETVDFSGVDIDVVYDETTETATLTSGESAVSVKLDFPEDWEFDGVYAGNVVNYRYEDGKLLCELGLDFSGRTVGYLARATGEVIFEKGKYTLGPLTLETN